MPVLGGSGLWDRAPGVGRTALQSCRGGTSVAQPSMVDTIGKCLADWHVVSSLEAKHKPSVPAAKGLKQNLMGHGADR